jgi:hypothetical protein
MPKSNPPPKPSKQPIIKVDAVTLTFVIAALILLPLLLTGFLSQ